MSEYPTVTVSPPPYGFHVNPNTSNDAYGKPAGSSNQPQWGGAVPYVTTTVVNTNVEQIETYMVWSVLNILFCCLCLGFVACYYSSETNNQKMRGNFQGALAASRNARTMNIIATVLGAILSVNYALYLSGAY